MMKTRMVWFSIGLASMSAASFYLVGKDIRFANHTLPDQFKEDFADLQARLSKLETPSTVSPHQD